MIKWFRDIRFKKNELRFDSVAIKQNLTISNNPPLDEF